jgi:hypothetical protein
LVDGKRNGTGILYKNDHGKKEVYSGEWKMDNMSGKGIYTTER